MCELLGASLKEYTDLREYMKTFFSHSPQHPHGWGMMRFANGKREIIKEAVCASQSSILDDVIAGTLPQKNFLAHIRLATVGSTKYENCHPFTGTDFSGRNWTLIHNGTIYSSGKLIKYMQNQTGNTDSERIFMFMLDLLNDEIRQHGALTLEQRFQIINCLTQELSKRNKLNLMIFDGDVLYVHKNMADTLTIKEDANGVVLSTQALDDTFTDFPICRLRAYCEGTLVMESPQQTTEFFPGLGNINTISALNI
ncbi:MAG: class II glutamine amidotransferase [Ruminococcus sp.]|nr:class II glutamine amidotransferase [Ruminococcus sp.]